MTKESYDEFVQSVRMNVDYIADVLSDQITIMAQTIYACVDMENKLIICSTGSNIPFCNSFCNQLNELLIPHLGNISSYSLNADQRIMNWLKVKDPRTIFSKQLNSIGKTGDLLIIAPAQIEKQNSLQAFQSIKELINNAKQNNIMIMLLNCIDDANEITSLLDSNDIIIDLAITNDENTSALLLNFLFQFIINSIRGIIMQQQTIN